jgi:prolyl 4-hydroxylase
MDQSAFERLWSAAQTGRGDAQESLAAILADAGRAEEARHWLFRATSTGRPSAETKLGLWEIVGYGGPADIGRGLNRILACAHGGDAEAAHMASILYGGGVAAPRDRTTAMRWLLQAARCGHVRATAQLGLLIGPEAESGANLLRIAAAQGSAVAMYALGRALRSGDERAVWLAAAAAAKHPLAVNAVAVPGPPRVERVHVPQWDRLADAADLRWVERPFRRQLEREQPHIESLQDFLPRSICDYVIGMAAPMLVRGKVVDQRGLESVSEVRRNAVMSFGLADSDFILELINLRIARAVDLPPENAEGLGVLHYRTGDSYAPHVDFLADTPANAAQLAARGQRIRTLLVYLNEDFDGGDTAFPQIGLGLKPGAGSALIFHNVDADGRTDPLTLHTGTAPTRGEKWAISKWFRNKALRPGAG